MDIDTKLVDFEMVCVVVQLDFAEVAHPRENVGEGKAVELVALLATSQLV